MPLLISRKVRMRLDLLTATCTDNSVILQGTTSPTAGQTAYEATSMSHWCSLAVVSFSCLQENIRPRTKSIVVSYAMMNLVVTEWGPDFSLSRGSLDCDYRIKNAGSIRISRRAAKTRNSSRNLDECEVPGNAYSHMSYRCLLCVTWF